MPITVPREKALKPMRIAVHQWRVPAKAVAKWAGADADFCARVDTLIDDYVACTDQASASIAMAGLMTHVRTLLPHIAQPGNHPTCPAGQYSGKIMSVEEGGAEEEPVVIEWVVESGEGLYVVPQRIETAEDAADLLIDLGLAGQTVEWADIIGLVATVSTRTFGHRTSARVVEVVKPTA